MAKATEKATDRFRRFLRDEDGLIMTEFLLLLPLLVWGFIALFIYWDAFRTINEAQKASYAISDLLSRQNDVQLTFVNGMDDVFEMMVTDVDAVRVRITSFEWDPDDNRYWVLFSRSPNNAMAQLTTAGMNGYRDKIPVMADHDSLIMVETEVDYTPIFDVGVNAQTFRNVVMTRPRYYRRICLVQQMTTCPATM